MSFLSRSSATQGAPDQAIRVQQVKEEVKAQLALANAQELINKMNEKCFIKCVPKPGQALENKEQQCLGQCTERFLEAFNVVSKSYVARLAKEKELGGASGLEAI
ncbi:hypothetical protein T439DRAFT_328436 [Meredithblackwellia eburnea MCA 4105]